MEIKLKTEPNSNRVVGIDLYLLNQYIIYIYVSVKDTLTYVTCSRCSTQRLWADVCHDAAGDPAGEDSEEPSTGDRAQGEHATLPDMQTTRLTNMLNSYFKCSFKDERISALEEKRRPLNESGNRPECYICHISLDKRVFDCGYISGVLVQKAHMSWAAETILREGARDCRIKWLKWR